MPGRSRQGNRGYRRPAVRVRRKLARKPAGGSAATRPQSKQLGLALHRLEGNDYELVHPRCVHDRAPDYQEGLELLRAGDPEGACDALRFALEGCGDNIWVHVALGQIALGDFHDPKLARGHFGYVVELAEHALPRPFKGRLPRERPANRPVYDALEGLAACYEALGRPRDAEPLRAQALRWARGPDQGLPPTRGAEPPLGPEERRL